MNTILVRITNPKNINIRTNIFLDIKLKSVLLILTIFFEIVLY